MTFLCCYRTIFSILGSRGMFLDASYQYGNRSTKIQPLKPLTCCPLLDTHTTLIILNDYSLIQMNVLGSVHISHLGTHFGAFHDEVSGHLQFSCHFLQTCRGYPGGRVVGVCFSHGFQQKTGLLDVTAQYQITEFHHKQQHKRYTLKRLCENKSMLAT